MTSSQVRQISVLDVQEIYGKSGYGDDFEKTIVKPPIAINDQKGESDDDCMKRVLVFEVSSKIKLADLRDNMDFFRLGEFGEWAESRRVRYARCVRQMEEKYHFREKRIRKKEKDVKEAGQAPFLLARHLPHRGHRSYCPVRDG